MLGIKNNRSFRNIRNIAISLCMMFVLSVFSTGFAQVSIIEQLADFIKNTNIEFQINSQNVGQQIPVYAENQDIGFSIVSQTSGYHYLYVVSGEGSSSLIYPNQFENTGYIQAGKQTNFPSNDTYRLIAQNGQGTDFHIVSIVSPTPLTGFTIGFTNGFNIIPPATQVIPAYQASAMRYRVQASSQTAANCASNCLYLSPAPALVQPPVYTPTASSTPAATANTATSTATSSSGSFNGYASYQEYLDNYYSQNNTATATTQTQAQTPTPSYTYTEPTTAYTQPVVTPVPVNPISNTATNYSVPNYAVNSYGTSTNTAGAFQGFASYQAYLDNYYSQNGGQSQSNVQASNTQMTNQAINQTVAATVATTTPAIGTPVTVYPTLNTPVANTSTTPATNLGSFQGFASYQDYLDNFYTQTLNLTGTTTTQVQQPVATDPFHGFGSYEAYLANYQATAGLTNSASTGITTTTNYGVYNVVPTQTTQAPNYAVNYSVTQQQLPNSANYTQLSPQPYAQPYTQAPSYPATTVNTNYAQPGFFDFEVGRDYTLFQSLGFKVVSIQDNRCPAGAQCIQAGNVVSTVEITFANVRRSFTITLLPGDEPSIGIGNTSLRFIGLSNTSSTALRVHVATR